MKKIKEVDLQLSLTDKKFIEVNKYAKQALEDAYSMLGVPASYHGLKPKEEK